MDLMFLGPDVQFDDIFKHSADDRFDVRAVSVLKSCSQTSSRLI